MWRIEGTEIHMAEGDWGVNLPVAVSGTTMGSSDNLVLRIKNAVNGTEILELVAGTPQNNVFNFFMAQAESALLTPGEYVYSLDWVQPGPFLYCLVPVGSFVVEDKA